MGPSAWSGASVRTLRSAVVVAAATSLVAIAAWGAVAAEPSPEPADTVVLSPSHPGIFTIGATMAPGRVAWTESGPGSRKVLQRSVSSTSPLVLGEPTTLDPSLSDELSADGRRLVFTKDPDGTVAFDGESTKRILPVGAGGIRSREASGHLVASRTGDFLDLAAGALRRYTDDRVVHWGRVAASGTDISSEYDGGRLDQIDRIDLDTGARTPWFTAERVGFPRDSPLHPLAMSSELVLFGNYVAGPVGVAQLGWFNWHTGAHGLLPFDDYLDSGGLSAYSSFVTVITRVPPGQTGTGHSSVIDTATGRSVLELDARLFMRLGSSGAYWSNYTTGEAKAASLPGVRAPIHEGNPITAKSYAPLSGKPWTAEFVFSEPLTTCSVEMSSATGALLKILPCDPRWTKFGEAVVSWDARSAGGVPLPRGSYRWSIKASGAGGPAQASPGSGTLTGSLAVEDDHYVAMTPLRLVANGTGISEITTESVPGGTVTEVPVAGVGPIPTTATTAVLNVTIVNPSHDGYATVYPSGNPRPSASNLNFAFAGPATANQVISRIGSNGRVSVFIYDPLHSFGGSIIVDIAGYYSMTPRFVSTTPTRLLDTRKTVRVPAGGKVDVQVAGHAGIPASGASAAALNVTALGGSGQPGYLTVWPAGSPRPTASNLNYTYGDPQPALAITKLGAGGKVSIYSSATSEVLVDVSGWFPATSDLRAISPARLLDTRYGIGAAKAPIGKSRAVSVQVTGRGGVPASGVKAVVLNVTATRTQAAGYLSAYPSGVSRPNTSVVNYSRETTVANSVIAKVGVGGKVDIFSWAGADAIVDVQGYVLN